ncbi:MAG TPA: 3-deoxy-7-phosphoheptulonate synthase, partial [Terriglobales bacterium]|nr:3-deoxy-7-phosphoheptulonate synthase [Terriglobales bacterium]
VVPAVQKLSHLPIIVDPSHGTGKRDRVHPMALASIACGASGLLVEVHPTPDHALSDGAQSLYPDQFAEVVGDCRAIAERVHAAGAQFFRGGAYKPRTSPYSFQGMGEEGLCILAEIRDRFGLRIVTEAVDHESLDLVERYADVIQIGARNMQNFSLLKRAGRAKKPVLLKRGMSATLEEFLMAAEYIMCEGNYQVILCERGVRTFADHTRNTLDLSLIPAVQRLSHLPILVDPSHGTGKRNKVTPLSRAAVAVGADGLMVEVHNNPDRALSDGMQSIYPDQFDDLMRQIRQIAVVVDRYVPQPAATRPSSVPATARS